MDSDLKQQISKARARTRKLKRAYPEMFPEYHRIKHAERDMRTAKQELDAARKAWRELGGEK